MAEICIHVAHVNLLLALAWWDGVEQFLFALREAGILGATLLAAGGNSTSVAGGRYPAIAATWRGDLAAGPLPDTRHFNQYLGLFLHVITGHGIPAALDIRDPRTLELTPRSIRIAFPGLDNRLGYHIALAPGALIFARGLVARSIVVQIQWHL